MLARKSALTVLLLLLGGVVVAGDDEVPDAEFLEYLGSWDESDEDWLVMTEPVAADFEERSDPVPQGEESTEKNDES